ncbi:protein kinase, partial [bacterium]|nr:protein kinase [bacterium]
AGILRRFQLEASAAGRLRHPGIVQVFEVGEHEGKPFIVMELVSGESLENLLAKAPLPPRRIAEIVREVALALEHAHENGIVHRDVKPENVIVDKDGRPHLMDFGLAREIGGSSRLTVTGQALGTPVYMAPEQASGDSRAMGPRSDIYALGGILYRALAGKPPFEAPSFQGLMKKILFEEPVPLREKNAAIHEDLETIVLRCLAKEPHRRYASATLVALDLKRFGEGEAIAARPVGRFERASVWARRNRALASALAALALGGIGSLVFILALTRYEHGRIRREAEIAAQNEDAKVANKAREEAMAARARLLAASKEPEPTEDEVEARRVDDAKAREWLAHVGVARTRVAKEHRAAVAALLEEASSGKLARWANGHDDALFALTAYREPEAVALISSSLDVLTRKLREATVSVYLTAAKPLPEEARAGALPIEGIEAALERCFSQAADEAGDPAAGRCLEAAERRIEDRQIRLVKEQDGARFQDVRRLVAQEQERRLGPEGLALAKLACEALGRIGIRETAVEALGRYLTAESDELRAAGAGEALLRLSGPRAVTYVLRARRRFGGSGIFSWRTRLLLQEKNIELGGSPTTAGELLDRASIWHAMGKLEAARAHVTRALEQDPKNASAWMLRGQVCLGLGDADAAIADLTRAIELEPAVGLAWQDRGLAWKQKGD